MRVFKCNTVADAYERAVLEILRNGYPRVTEEEEYTLETDEIALEVRSPLDEPRISDKSPFKYAYMEEYAKQVLEGTISQFDYDYHNRLFHWGETSVGVILKDVHKTGSQMFRECSVDQIDYIVEKLSEVPESRRAIANTWIPEIDCQPIQVPCLQSVFFIIRNNHLDLTVTIRSNDMLMAAGCNMYAFTILQDYVLSEINLHRMEQEMSMIELGKYTHISFVPHVYVKRDEDHVREWIL